MKTSEIKEAVENAEGWELYTGMSGHDCAHSANREVMAKLTSKVLLDALAGQLKRQIDAMDDFRLVEKRKGSKIKKLRKIEWRTERENICSAFGPHRHENTILACNQFYRERNDD